MPKLDIVIPAAGLGRRMKSLGPKALLKVGAETVIARQIRVLAEVYPGARVIVVVGFSGERLRRALPPGIKVVVNPDYDTTNVAHSLALGLAATHRHRSVLVVYGDLVFDPSVVAGLPTNRSSVVVECAPERAGEVGVNVVDGKAVHFSYGLATRWAQIAMLAPCEKNLFLAACRRTDLSRHFGFEVLNRVLDAGGEFAAVSRPDTRLAEIDCPADVARAEHIAVSPVDG